MSSTSRASDEGGARAPLAVTPSVNSLRWLIGLRLVVVSTLFLGVLIIQVNTQILLHLKHFYGLILLSYGLSLCYLVIHLRGLSTRLQAITQLLGDIALVTGFVYFTGGLYSPFSFLYLTVIVVGAVLLRGGGLIFAGLSAIAYGVLVDLMIFGVLPIPANLAGFEIPISTSRVLYQIMIHVVGFVLVAFLVSYLLYHAQVGSVRFQGVGLLRHVYLTILVSHSALAVVNLPLVVATLLRALGQRFDAHRRLARVTLPIWGYVSITGVVVYWMLYWIP